MSSVFRWAQIVFLLLLSTWLTPPVSAQTEDYSIQVSYQVASAHFLRAVQDAVKDIKNKDEILDWAEAVSKRLPEFLNDMIAVSKEVSEQSLTEPSLEPFYEFEQKWMGILQTCPNCDQFVPLLSPLVHNLIRDLPQLKPNPQDAPPFTNMTNYYQRMAQLDPWDLGALFQIIFVTPQDQQLLVSEQKRVRRRGILGEDIYVLRRLTQQWINGKVMFKEVIENDRLNSVSYAQDPITLLHEAWRELYAVEGDTVAVRFWKSIIDVMDRELQLATHAELFDDFTYYFLYDQVPVTGEMAVYNHPLLNPQYKDEYKIAEFYPRKFYNPSCYSPENCLPVDYVGFSYP